MLKKIRQNELGEAFALFAIGNPGLKKLLRVEGNPGEADLVCFMTTSPSCEEARRSGTSSARSARQWGFPMPLQRKCWKSCENWQEVLGTTWSGRISPRGFVLVLAEGTKLGAAWSVECVALRRGLLRRVSSRLAALDAKRPSIVARSEPVFRQLDRVDMATQRLMDGLLLLRRVSSRLVAPGVKTA
jgi:hypothetical protein